jgi:hypothetical protein
MTAELDTVRQKSREREHACLKLKDEIQVANFPTTSDATTDIKPVQSFVRVEQIPGLLHQCFMSLYQEHLRFLREFWGETNLSIIFLYCAKV